MTAALDHAGAALAAARAAGLAARAADVVAVAANVLVRVQTDAGPVAARLAGATASFRDPAATLGREARLSAELAAAGAPVPAPLGGPYEAGGRVVTLWPWLELRDGGDAALAGRALAACHAALEHVAEPLEPLAMLVEARRLAQGAPPAVRAVALPAVDRALAELDGAPRRAVHGDSHPGNVLWTAAGAALWSDWEDAHLAPLEWDLACLVAAGRRRGDDFGWSQAALEAHGGPYDPELLDACVRARTAQGVAYLAHVRPPGPARDELLRERLAWLGGR